MDKNVDIYGIRTVIEAIKSGDKINFLTAKKLSEDGLNWAYRAIN